MPKNNYLINREKQLRKQFESLVPAVYASIAIVLDYGGMDYGTISDIFYKSQQIWEEHGGNVNDLLIKCYNLTGIQLMTEKQYDFALKQGLIQEDEQIGAEE